MAITVEAEMVKAKWKRMAPLYTTRAGRYLRNISGFQQWVPVAAGLRYRRCMGKTYYFSPPAAKRRGVCCKC